MKLRSLTFVFLFISFVTFILGVWQLYRLNWKNDLIENINNSVNSPKIFDDDEEYEELITISLNNDFDLIDKFEKVTDEDAAIFTRKLAKEEGIFAGNSCGAAVKGLIQLKENFKKDDVVVVLLHDSGSRYIGKIYNDEWMKKNNFKLDI